MSKENETSDKQQNGNDFIADVSRSLLKLNAKIEILDEILERRGQITIRYIERIRKEHFEHMQKLINENCG